MKFIIRLKGGTGSGNFGHAGRPGEVGGSQSGVDYHFTGISSLAQSRLTYDRNGQLNKIGDIIDELPLTHTMIDYIGDIDIDVRPDLGTYVGGSFGKTIQFSSRLIDGKYPDSLSLQYSYAPTMLHGVVSHELGHHMQRRMLMEDRISWDNLAEDRELFESFSHNRLPDVNPEFPTSMRSVELFAEAFSKYLWDPQSLPVKVLDYMDSTLGDKVVEKQQTYAIIIRMKGGEGSGNFGHAGREGEVGGSAPADGGENAPNATSLQDSALVAGKNYYGGGLVFNDVMDTKIRVARPSGSTPIVDEDWSYVYTYNKRTGDINTPEGYDPYVYSSAEILTSDYVNKFYDKNTDKDIILVAYNASDSSINEFKKSPNAKIPKSQSQSVIIRKLPRDAVPVDLAKIPERTQSKFKKKGIKSVHIQKVDVPGEQTRYHVYNSDTGERFTDKRGLSLEEVRWDYPISGDFYPSGNE